MQKSFASYHLLHAQRSDNHPKVYTLNLDGFFSLRQPGRIVICIASPRSKLAMVASGGWCCNKNSLKHLFFNNKYSALNFVIFLSQHLKEF